MNRDPTMQDVVDYFQAAIANGRSQAQLANDFRVHKNTISRIINRIIKKSHKVLKQFPRVNDPQQNQALDEQIPDLVNDEEPGPNPVEKDEQVALLKNEEQLPRPAEEGEQVPDLMEHMKIIHPPAPTTLGEEEKQQEFAPLVIGQPVTTPSFGQGHSFILEQEREILEQISKLENQLLKQKELTPNQGEESVIVGLPYRGPKGTIFDSLAFQSNQMVTIPLCKEIDSTYNQRRINEELRVLTYNLSKKIEIQSNYVSPYVDIIVIPGRSRKFEHEQKRANTDGNLISQALKLGQPILGICAGEWRLFAHLCRRDLTLKFWEKIADMKIKMLKNAQETLNFFKKCEDDIEKSLYNLDTLDGNLKYCELWIEKINNQLQGLVLDDDVKILKSLFEKIMQDDTEFLKDTQNHNSRRMMSISLVQNKVNYNNMVHSLELKDSLVKQFMEKKDTVEIFEEKSVNSVHWRAINEKHLPNGVEIGAISPHDGVPEAFSSTLGSPLMGVQWHPEAYNANHPHQAPHRRMIQRMGVCGLAYRARCKALQLLKTKQLSGLLNSLV
ncbi:hypothetical protein CYY_003988 [Polysphondylium violaceum]|uniref:Uncharacterized protein n=1 Tax=Polysphondylium violaceum TaxID=133409 RepID=A0A8J4PY57_9MYCE|nr:hypothetical protein CYY_003988 [Polysphondylium violaceum]